MRIGNIMFTRYFDDFAKLSDSLVLIGKIMCHIFFRHHLIDICVVSVCYDYAAFRQSENVCSECFENIPEILVVIQMVRFDISEYNYVRPIVEK